MIEFTGNSLEKSLNELNDLLALELVPNEDDREFVKQAILSVIADGFSHLTHMKFFEEGADLKFEESYKGYVRKNLSIFWNEKIKETLTPTQNLGNNELQVITVVPLKFKTLVSNMVDAHLSLDVLDDAKNPGNFLS